MIQNSAYGNPMLDGASAFPDIYIQHQSADKPEGPPPSNNNIANYTNRNSGYPYQTCVASAPAPLVARESCVRAEFVKDTQDLAVGFRQLSHNVPIKTEHCIANNVATNETGGELGITTARPKASEQMLQTVDQKPYESFTQQSIAYVQTPAAAGEEREREEEQDVGAKASPKKEQRRPMNAFLIFCKRHRTMLKNRFPEENRAISIKLGKWWRMLTTEQKKPFQLLSKEYKNKYLSLNPNFRWCKQPMVPATPSTPSPLVTLAPNATNVLSLAAVRPEPSFVQDNRESLEAAESLVQLAQGKPLLSVFRLADESNMGSLNELCVGPNVGSRADNKEPTWKPPKATQTVGRELPAPPTPSISGNALTEPIAAEGRSSPRATRSCKGKKYQELMSRMYPNAHAPQTKRSPGARMQKDNQKLPKTATVAAGGDDQTGFLYSNTAMPELDPLAIDALMMELDSKISDLPAMNVGDFCILLNSEKKRKKSFTKLPKQKLFLNREEQPSTVASVTASGVALQSCNSMNGVAPPIATITQPATNGVDDSVRPVVHPGPPKIVGCRKRKAPKECITRNPRPSVVEREVGCGLDPRKDDTTCHDRTCQA
ncbi:uncharacterized protein LOC121588987 [Anopheles merus]|uniref:uncharacterized protein LOC121588987 n=1 Tax=Anopheles merus TaxID=30066 RepID=UPI001BE42D60|nr:uncharacterized protein LOC121588987 [Anopheles merus]XP_041763424.1 uncharacterized protein LOC121588987 [Anopheles merus]